MQLGFFFFNLLIITLRFLLACSNLTKYWFSMAISFLTVQNKLLKYLIFMLARHKNEIFEPKKAVSN